MATVAASRVEVGRGTEGQLLLAASGVLGLVNLYLIFFWVPTEQVMGIVQRIFYVHVPTVWVGFVAFFFVALSSLAYLIKRDVKWDHRAQAAAEIGVVFLTVSIVSGAVWAKPVWGTWWTWDPKLTSVFVLWVMFIGYLMVRAYAPGRRQAATWSAVVGIIAFADVPIVYLASEWWRSLHPELVAGPLSESGSLESSMRITLYFSTLTFTLIFAYLFRTRVAQRRDEDMMDELRAAVS